MRIVDLVMRFETHAKNARDDAEKDVSDYYVYNTLAMECFQSVNALIEIGEWVVTEKKNLVFHQHIERYLSCYIPTKTLLSRSPSRSMNDFIQQLV